MGLLNQKRQQRHHQPQQGDLLNKGMVSTKDLIALSFIEVVFNHLKIDEKYYRTLLLLAIHVMFLQIG